MRELAATGFMHNRVRMIVASFLTKDLLLDWRLGERHFMRHLVDGDLASNNGGWQWAAGDRHRRAAVLPHLQSRPAGRDASTPTGAYVRRWVPELAAGRAAGSTGRGRRRHSRSPRPPALASYPAPIVDHRSRRELASPCSRAWIRPSRRPPTSSRGPFTQRSLDRTRFLRYFVASDIS